MNGKAVRNIKDHVSVLVIGGGPAGSTAATLLAREGIDVTLLERDVFPREHIGESLLPSILTILDALGAREKFEAHGFVRKYGAYLDWGVDEWELRFGEPEDPNAHYAYQVVRPEFDKMLLDNAAEKGANVVQGVEVKEILFEDNRPRRARWRIRDTGEEGEISFDRLIDASGRAGLMSNRYNRDRRFNEGFKNVAVYSYWEGADTSTKGPQGAVLVGAIRDGWIWAIPLHNGLLSVGAVVHRGTFASRRAEAGDSLEQLYETFVGESKLINDVLQNARRVRPILAEQDFSYVCDRAAGPGYFIIGDAARFLDPLLSSGVHLATLGGLLAAAGTASILRGEISEPQAVAYFEDAYRTSYTRFLVLVASLYQSYRGKESLFWEAQKLSHRDVPSCDIQSAFRNIVTGLEDMSDAEDAGAGHVIESMRRLIDTYFPKDSGKDDAWLATLPQEKQAEVLRELKPMSVTGEYCLSEDTAVQGLYVRLQPRLGLARSESRV